MNNKIYLIIGGLIIMGSLYLFAMTSSPIEAKTPLEYTRECEFVEESKSYLGALQKCISGVWAPQQLSKDIPAEAKRPFHNAMSMVATCLGAMIFIYRLSLRHKQQKLPMDQC